MVSASQSAVHRFAGRGARRSSGLACVGAFAASAVLACAVCVLWPAPHADAFAMVARKGPMRGSVVRGAEAEAAAAPAPAPAPSSSVALVKITEESTMTSASVLGGLAGLWFGGVWLGAGLFAATSYLARKDENKDVATVLKSFSSATLQVLNFGAELNSKYNVTGQLGDAIEGALTPEGGSSPLKSVTSAVESVDAEVGIKDTVGSIATSASELASQAVEKVLALSTEYKVVDQIKEKLDQTTKSN
mmetsp:Transcript_94306/g.266303  ORF Transcript_94306/g.266303 Transcript_94306/m.266303 type:complete len:247 (-) Transcript_94306:129-869(-)|eukprot:CAMPEP_0117491142 /NCGR_PEP_ID=MMETSP0784-20121206/17911_1 /TAXON_ID=39447 /ORGANISM="" /LENGTH=246 /DNA_ID=CAMNT_0005285917 /DNA_START=71 /DNA_END=811 /DNA_ORIENTATION=+